MRQEQMRKSLGKFRGEIIADTTIRRKYPLFHFGMADWNVILTQQLQGNKDARFTMNLGSILAGGEANVRLNYDTRSGFQLRNQFFEWRFVNNDFKVMRQATVGQISTFSTSTINHPVLGVLPNPSADNLLEPIHLVIIQNPNDSGIVCKQCVN